MNDNQIVAADPIILSETENVQDYSKQNNTKFYK